MKKFLFFMVILLAVIFLFSCMGKYVFSVPDQEIEEGSELVVNLKEHLSEAFKEPLIFDHISGKGYIKGNEYRYSPDYDEAGEYEVILLVKDSKDKEVRTTFELEVIDMGDYSFSVPDQEVEEGSTLVINLEEYISDAFKEPVTFEHISGKGYIEDSEYRYSPSYDEAGESEVNLSVEDSNEKVMNSAFTISVINVNREPEGEIIDKTFFEGDEIIIDIQEHFSDPDDDKLSFELVDGTGKIDKGKYIPFDGPAVPGIFTIRISVSDGKGGKVEETFALFIREKLVKPSVDELDVVFEVDKYEILKVDLREYYEISGKDRFEQVEGPGVLSFDGHYYYMPSKEDEKEQEVIFRIVRNQESDEDDENLQKFYIKIQEKTEESTLEVGSGEDMYRTIQSALKVAKSGDVILVHPGTYEENITLTKGVVIRGVDRDSVILNSRKSTSTQLYIRQASGFSIENLTLVNVERALMVSRSSGQVVNCRLIGGKTAVTYSSGKNDLLIRNSYISTLENEDVEDLPGERYYGIYAYGDGRLILESTVINYCGTGLMATNDLLFRISDSKFDKNRIGISLAGDSTGYIVGNDVTRNEENGILINSDSIVTLNENKFYSNVLHGLDLYLRMCTDCGCGGSVFRGTVLGENNVFDDPKAICPVDRDWPENFYKIDETLGN